MYIDATTGRQKNVMPAGAKLTERVRLGVHPNKRMRVGSGRHEGLVCTVLSVNDQVSNMYMHTRLHAGEAPAA